MFVLAAEEIKAEPISPLPASPYSSIYSPAPDNKTEIQVRIDKLREKTWISSDCNLDLGF